MHSASNHARRGTILVLSVILMVAMMGMLAFAIDAGYLFVARTELQRAADSAALAAAWELIDDDVTTTMTNDARTTAQTFAGLNNVCSSTPLVDANVANSADGDIVIGTIADFGSVNPTMTFTDPDSFNAIKVRIDRTTSQNGQVPYFFARVLGIDSSATFAEATAAVIKNVRGFRKPPNQTLGFLPIALDVETWDDLMDGIGTDDFTWDAENMEIESGGDGVLEVSLYPTGTGSPGNRGTVNVGTNNNSTSHLSDQILNGLSQADLDFHGGELALDANGELLLGGDPGISAAIKDDLQAIAGEPRVIPLFESVSGPGNNAVYVIIRFVGIRIMEVRLTGKNKRVIIQPADVVMAGTISGEEGYSEFVYSFPHLVK